MPLTEEAAEKLWELIKSEMLGCRRSDSTNALLTYQELMNAGSQWLIGFIFSNPERTKEFITILAREESKTEG